MSEKNNVTLVDAGDLQPKSSFELTKNRNGVTMKVKIYTSDSATDLDKAMKECTERFEALRKKYEG